MVKSIYITEKECLFFLVHTGATIESRPRYSGFYHGVKSVFSQTGPAGLYRVWL